MEISTNRLQIRAFRKTDLEDVYEIYRNSETCRFLLHEAWSPSIKEKELDKKILASQLSQDAPVSLACVLDHKVIGDITVWFVKMRETVEIGYVFNEQYSRQGYAVEAIKGVIEHLFNTVKVHRIQTNLDTRNLASASLCERLGMRKEAHFIQNFWNKGEWIDSFGYGMLRSDFINQTK